VKTEVVLGEKPAPESLCPPQISPGLTQDRTEVSAVLDRRHFGLQPKQLNMFRVLQCMWYVHEHTSTPVLFNP